MAAGSLISVSMMSLEKELPKSAGSLTGAKVTDRGVDKPRRWLRREVWLGVAAILVMVALCAVAVYYKDALMSVANIAQYSLLGVFVIAFIAGSIISMATVPVPYYIVVFTLPSVLVPQWGLLAPVWVGMVSALGASLGQFLTFIIAYGGSHLSQRLSSRIANGNGSRIMEWAKRHGSWAVFVMSAVFNPFHLPMTMAIAVCRYPVWKFFLFSLLGNAVKSLFIAFCGYYGLSSVFNLLGL
jgi:membrane protein DedA with SNARE-associated domain